MTSSIKGLVTYSGAAKQAMQLKLLSGALEVLISLRKQVADPATPERKRAQAQKVLAIYEAKFRPFMREQS
jgi:hypothetical protein